VSTTARPSRALSFRGTHSQLARQGGRRAAPAL